MAYVYNQLQIDEQWSVQEPRGFTWWAYQLAQRVWAEPAREIDGDLSVCLRAETDLLRNVPQNQDLFKVLSTFNAMASLNAMVWDPQDHRVTLRCTAYVHTQVEWVKPLFVSAALMQNIEAHSRAHGLKQFIGGELAVSSHPESKERPEMDDLLNLAETVVVPAGQKASPFAGEDLEGLLKTKPAPWVLATGDATGLTGEFPYTDAMPALARAALTGSTEDGNQPVGTALFRVGTSERHTGYGSGALLTLQLPVRFQGANAAQQAQALNRAESREWTNFPLFGAWCLDPQRADSVAYVMFIPAAFHRPGLLDAMSWYMAGRCRWVKDNLARLSDAAA